MLKVLDSFHFVGEKEFLPRFLLRGRSAARRSLICD
jgi:hypothetical protein